MKISKTRWAVLGCTVCILGIGAYCVIIAQNSADDVDDFTAAQKTRVTRWQLPAFLRKQYERVTNKETEAPGFHYSEIALQASLLSKERKEALKTKALQGKSALTFEEMALLVFAEPHFAVTNREQIKANLPKHERLDFLLPLSGLVVSNSDFMREKMAFIRSVAKSNKVINLQERLCYSALNSLAMTPLPELDAEWKELLAELENPKEDFPKFLRNTRRRFIASGADPRRRTSLIYSILACGPPGVYEQKSVIIDGLLFTLDEKDHRWKLGGDGSNPGPVYRIFEVFYSSQTINGKWVPLEYVYIDKNYNRAAASFLLCFAGKHNKGDFEREPYGIWVTSFGHAAGYTWQPVESPKSE